MSKMPVIGMIGFCWLGVAFAGCTNVPKQYTGGTPTGSTFGSNTKPPLTADAPPPATPASSGLTQAQGTGPSSLAPRDDGSGFVRGTSGRTPGDVGLDGAAPGLNDLNKKTPPAPGLADGSQVTTSRTPGAVSGVSFPSPPPIASNTMQLPASSVSPLDQRPTTRTTALPLANNDVNPPLAPPAPAGTLPPPDKGLFPSGNMKPPDYGTVHSVPTPPPAGTPPLPTTPPIDASALPPVPTPAAPAAPTAPFMPGGSK